jgi:hypothetical protein
MSGKEEIMQRLFNNVFFGVIVSMNTLLQAAGNENPKTEKIPSAESRVVVGTEQDVFVVFTVRIIHRGKQAVENPEIRMRLPFKDAHQDIDDVEIEGRPQHWRDRENLEVVVYQQPELPPGGVMSGRWTAECRRRELQWNLKKSTTNNSLKLSDEEKALYLRDTKRYGLQTPEVQATLRKATAGRNSEIAKLEGIHDYVMNHVKYVIDDYWEPAPKVLASGKGSCSEFTYTFIALCRAAGIPARYAGGIAGRADMPYHVDTIFHRFPQAFVEGVGWADFDPTRNRRSKNRGLYFGRTPRQMLLLCIADGGDGSLTGWDYRASTDWKSKILEPFANEVSNDAATHAIQTAWWFPAPPADIRHKVAVFREQWEKTPPDGRQPLIAEALKINHPLALPWLDDLLYDRGLRVEAASAMLKIGGKEAIRAVADSLGRLNDRVGDGAIGEALDKFTGEKIGPSRKKWEKWLKAHTHPAPLQ